MLYVQFTARRRGRGAPVSRRRNFVPKRFTKRFLREFENYVFVLKQVFAACIISLALSVVSIRRPMSAAIYLLSYCSPLSFRFYARSWPFSYLTSNLGFRLRLFPSALPPVISFNKRFVSHDSSPFVSSSMFFHSKLKKKKLIHFSRILLHYPLSIQLTLNVFFNSFNFFFV